MTKHLPDEPIQKCQLGFVEANKIVETTAKALDSNALFICHTNMNSEPETRIRVTRVKPKMHTSKTRLGNSMQKLYDLEPENEPEKPLKINFNVDLYQMEDV